jgi:hypothetical protein
MLPLDWKPEPMLPLDWKPEPMLPLDWKPEPMLPLDWKPEPMLPLAAEEVPTEIRGSFELTTSDALAAITAQTAIELTTANRT